MAEAVTLHLAPNLAAARGKGDPFYRALVKGLKDRGVPVNFAVHDRATAKAEVEADLGFHLFDHGRIEHPRALNMGLAYLPPFRYFDPAGIRLYSSIAQAVFDPAAQDLMQAAALFQRLRLAFVETRSSRYDQPDEALTVPKGCIAVFLQSERHKNVLETGHLTLRQMVKALLDCRDPRPIVVKPHPRDTDFETYGWLGQKAKKDARLHILPANIHDILEVADVAVTINSAVGIEAMLHRCPVVLCGRTDFHHICETVTRREALEAAIARATARRATGDIPFEAYLGWFYGQQCLDPTAPDFYDRLFARMASRGFDPASLGI